MTELQQENSGSPSVPDGGKPSMLCGAGNLLSFGEILLSVMALYLFADKGEVLKVNSAFKRFIAIITILFLALCMTACQESDESKYSRASKLLNEGKYDEAVKLFDEISAYDDASKMAMYGRAVAAAENKDYISALQSFKALGDYKDCPMMITYYTARQYEEQASDVNWSPRIMAAEAYDTIVLFLDSKDRAENNRKTVYDSAVHLAELKQYSESMAMLSALRDYEDSALLRRYYEAFNLEQEDKFTEASHAFAAMEDYRDSKEQASEVLKRGYQEADGQERLGKQEEAYQIFMNLAECEYEDSFERANKPYYDLGMSLRAEKKWPDAIAAFEHAGTYSDAETQVKETKYMQAFDKREQHNWDAAIEIFTALGDYKDSTTVQINETNYQRADALEKEGKQEEAYKLFISLGRYGDAFVRANKPYYDLGVAKREAGEWDAAVAAFEHAGLYEDAKEQIKATRYAEGISKRESHDWKGAIDAFTLAENYSDAIDQISATELERKNWDMEDQELSATKENAFSIITVKVTMRDGEITECSIESEGDQDLLTDEIKSEWANAIVSSNSAMPDVITSSSFKFSAESVREAMADILNQ